jgi:multiple sugar transport system substrate-binding protein
MKDIARLAGVSHGTVSNVMNRKGNVQSEKIRLVEDAARRLGYLANTQARNLRKESSRHCALILPDIEQRGYRVFYTVLKNLLEESQYDTSLYLSRNSPETEGRCIRSALSGRPEYIVSVNSAAAPGEYPGEDAGGETTVIFVNNPSLEPAGNQVSFLFDFSEAALAFAGRIVRKNGAAAFFFDSGSPPAHRVFFEALRAECLKNRIDLVPFYYDSRQIFHGALAILERSPPFDTVVTNSPLYAERLRRAGELLGKDPPPALSFGSRETLDGSGEPVYRFDYRELAARVFSAVRENEKYRGKVFPVKARGFTGEPRLFPAAAVRDLTMLTITSPLAEILETLSPYLKRTAGIGLRVVALPYEELFALLSSGRPSPFDLVRIDMAWGARFEKNLYLPLDPLYPRLAPLIGSFLPSIRQVYCPEDRELCSLPFDPSIQMLFYRRDLFEDATIRRLYYEKTRERLEVPRNFSEYNRIAAFFTASENPASPVPFGTTMTFGSTTVAACDILPRIRSMGGEIFDQTGRPGFNSGIFRQALEDYLSMRPHAGPEIHYWWGDSLNAFIRGQAAMTVVFFNHASRIIRADNAGIHARAGAAPVPGNFPLLGGGCIGISKESRNIDLCIDFFNWVYSDEIANMITLLGGLSPQGAVFSNEEILEVYPWLREAGEHFKQGWRRLQSPRYPQFDNYQFERILGDAVRGAALGILSPAGALQSAQEEYDREFSPEAPTGSAC